MEKFYVYELRSKKAGMKYIGSSGKLEVRIKRHFKELNSCFGDSRSDDSVEVSEQQP